MKQIMEEMELFRIVMLIVSVVCIYVVLIVVYAIMAHQHYTRKYNWSCKRVERFRADLAALENLYEKEKA